MKNRAEQLTENFYRNTGWCTTDGITEDARRWEDLRQHSKAYISKCRRRVLKHIPVKGEYILDMASGPIQYPEYLEYSAGFSKRYCVDLSPMALESAERKIGCHGVFLQGSIFDLDLKENFFDCTISLHTIYHIDKDLQEEAVRKLMRVTKAGAPIIVVYSNPNTLLARFRTSSIYRRCKRIRNQTADDNPPTEEELYFLDHPLSWWERFRDTADIDFHPWRSFDSDTQKRIIPDNKFGEILLSFLYLAESLFPKLFVKFFQYPMIILRKRA